MDYVIMASWCHWTFNKPVLPKTFYAKSEHPDNLYQFASSLKGLFESKNQPKSHAHMEELLLGLGLALRDVHFVLFTEPEELSGKLPSYSQDIDLAAWDVLTATADYLAAVIER